MSDIIKEIKINFTRFSETSGNCFPVCLRWKNSKGGFGVWVFPKEVVLTPEVQQGQIFKKGISSYADASDIYARTQSGFQEIVQLSDKGLQKHEVKGLNYLIAAPKVWEITKDSTYPGGFKYTEVVVRSVEASVFENHPLADFSLIIERPPKPFF